MCLAMGLRMVIIFRGLAGAEGDGIIWMMRIIVSDIIALRERFWICANCPTESIMA